MQNTKELEKGILDLFQKLYLVQPDFYITLFRLNNIFRDKYQGCTKSDIETSVHSLYLDNKIKDYTYEETVFQIYMN